ncbi:small hydrophilic protein [Streptomyces sp. NPDC093546]|uniref:small hydrophilic protein n=1 Tax=Streptomyces sp. NPDC093546 TaxID=3366040 RepID=UPI00381CC665
MAFTHRMATLAAVVAIPLGIAATSYVLTDSPEAPHVPPEVELDATPRPGGSVSTGAGAGSQSPTPTAPAPASPSPSAVPPSRTYAPGGTPGGTPTDAVVPVPPAAPAPAPAPGDDDDDDFGDDALDEN